MTWRNLAVLVVICVAAIVCGCPRPQQKEPSDPAMTESPSPSSPAVPPSPPGVGPPNSLGSRGASTSPAQTPTAPRPPGSITLPRAEHAAASLGADFAFSFAKAQDGFLEPFYLAYKKADASAMVGLVNSRPDEAASAVALLEFMGQLAVEAGVGDKAFRWSGEDRLGADDLSRLAEAVVDAVRAPHAGKPAPAPPQAGSPASRHEFARRFLALHQRGDRASIVSLCRERAEDAQWMKVAVDSQVVYCSDATPAPHEVLVAREPFATQELSTVAAELGACLRPAMEDRTSRAGGPASR